MGDFGRGPMRSLPFLDCILVVAVRALLYFGLLLVVGPQDRQGARPAYRGGYDQGGV